MNVAEVAERSSGLLDEVERAVVGKRAALELVLLGLLADGHVLIEDFPGLAKTLIARSFAQATERSPQWVNTLRRMTTSRESGTTTPAMCVVPCAVTSRSWRSTCAEASTSTEASSVRGVIVSGPIDTCCVPSSSSRSTCTRREPTTRRSADERAGTTSSPYEPGARTIVPPEKLRAATAAANCASLDT